MKTSVFCYPCYLRQALQLTRLTGCSEKIQHQTILEVAKLFPQLSLQDNPPQNSLLVYEAIAKTTRIADPYAHQKKESNLRALAVIDRLRQEVRAAENQLDLAIRFSIAGNIIDYGAHEHFDIDTALDASRKVPLALDHSDILIKKIQALPANSTILYLADNCGEIVYDSLLVELLAADKLQVTVAVKKAPIINDATREDAVQAGLGSYAKIIDNGTACPGTPLGICSQEFLSHYSSADLVISKGQGNFETLSEEKRDIFFLLTIKCAVVGQHLAELSGSDQTKLNGKGEMVVFYSGITGR